MSSLSLPSYDGCGVLVAGLGIWVRNFAIENNNKQTKHLRNPMLRRMKKKFPIISCLLSYAEKQNENPRGLEKKTLVIYGNPPTFRIERERERETI